MNVSAIIADLARKFPNQADNIRAWMPEYSTALERHAGERLAEAYRVCMIGWKAGWAPRPADIAAHLPGRPQPKTDDDVAERVRITNERQRRLVDAANDWWKTHGHDPALFWEYNHRSKFGEPGAADYQQFEAQKKARARLPKVEGFKTLERATVKPNYVPRNVVCEAQAQQPDGPYATEPREGADSGVHTSEAGA